MAQSKKGKKNTDLADVLYLAEQDIDKVIRIQSHIRGFLTRKHNKQTNEMNDPKP